MSTTVPVSNLCVTRGDNKTIQLQINDANGSAVNTTGWTVQFQARTEPDATATVISKTSAVSGEIDANDILNGLWDVKLLPADVATAANLYYDVQVTTDSGSVHTIVKGRLEIERDVTR